MNTQGQKRIHNATKDYFFLKFSVLIHYLRILLYEKIVKNIEWSACFVKITTTCLYNGLDISGNEHLCKNEQR